MAPRKRGRDPDAVVDGDPDGLTSRQIAFIDHYLGDCRFNAAKAAKAAGYANRQEAYRILTIPTIRARIDEELAALAATRDEVLTMLHDDATMDIDAILAAKHIKDLDPVTRSSVTSGLLGARTTARGTLAKAYGLLSDHGVVSGGIEIVIRGVDDDKV